MIDECLARTRRVGAVLMVAALGLCSLPPIASRTGSEALAADDNSLGLDQTRRLISLAQPKLADPEGWATDILWSLEFSGIPHSPENVCAMIATVDQESNFKANPPVEGLARRRRANRFLFMDGSAAKRLRSTSDLKSLPSSFTFNASSERRASPSTGGLALKFDS